MTSRLDNFTDAAFAFAVTLLVIGGSEAPTSQAMLAAAIADGPAFAIGFAIITMFWFAHVRWRRYRGEGNWLSSLLSVALVFWVLVYVQPLRAMALSFSTFLGGSGTRFEGDVGELFWVYGLGFVSMSALTAGLFAEARFKPALPASTYAAISGEFYIWMILVLTGVVSIALSVTEATEDFAPLVYATLPFTIGLFTWRYDWEGKKKSA